MKHGTRAKYINEQCRCSKCTKANREYLRIYNAARRNGKVTKRGS